MTYRLPPLNALRAFESAARHLSFKKAADELSVTPTAVSHQIRGLEDYLGVGLFHRRTRAVELTDEGKAMLPKVREGLECFAAAVELTHARRGMGGLSVSAPPSFATRWLVPRLEGFTASHPGVQLHLTGSRNTIDDKHGGGALEAELDLREDVAELAIRFGAGHYPGCRVELLLVPEYTVVCSPRLLASGRPLAHPDDVRHHVLIHDDTIPDEEERPNWSDWLEAAGVRGVDARPGPHFGDSGLALTAAADGLGLALASRALVAREVAEGRLVIPFDISIHLRYAYYLVTPLAVAHRPAVAAFRDWLLTEAATERSAA